MRLIDANELMQKIVQYDNENIQSPNRKTIVDVIDTIFEMITEQPTAYDIDKVVEGLEDASCYIEDGDGHAGHLVFTDEAIEIVKGGLNE